MIKTKLSVAIAALGTIASSGVFAQESIPGPEVEEVVVTGSRIARDPLSTTGPITLVDSEAIQRSGVGTIDELLNQLPSMGTTGINANDNNGGAGLSFVDLRNLGSARTLVLVNGRRFVSSSSGVASAVDMNNIPVDMIDRIEVLTDGASAVYGSDAVAGVINVVLKDSFDGVRINARAGATEAGGGENGELSITFGKEFDRGQFIGNITHSKRDEITFKDRDWAGLESSMSPTGNIYTDYGKFGVDSDGKTLGAFSYYDIGQYMWLSGAMERTSFTGSGTFSITDAIEFYGEGSYTSKTTNQQLAAQPMYNSNGLKITSDNLPAEVQAQLADAWQEAEDAYQIELAAYNAALAEWKSQGSPKDLEPSEPEASHGDSWQAGLTDVRLRPVAGGTRDSEQQTETYRILGGLRGDLANGWGWDTFVSYGKNEGENTVGNSINKTLMQQILDGTSGIAEENIQLLGGMSDEVIDYISYTDREDNEYEMLNFGASLTGDIEAIQFQGGALGFASGIEYRKESGEFNPSAETQSGATYSNQQDATSGDFAVTEVFAEFNLPILSGAKYADELSVDAAVRYSDYDTFGGQATYKLGAVYAPTENLRFRSSLSTAFRAPGIYELYSGTAQSYETLIDPCDTSKSNTKGQGDHCGDLSSSFLQAGNQIATNIGGNQDLQPEESTSFTAGVVWTPAFTEDLSITLDYFNVEIKDAITSTDLQQLLDDCYRSGIAAACSEDLVRRDSTGQIVHLEGSLQNIGEINTSGIDIDIVQNFHYDTGKLALRAQATHLLEYDVYDSQTKQTTDNVDYIGTTGDAYTKWRGLASATWYADNWDFGADVQYIGDGHSPYLDMPSHTYLNLKAGWDVNEAMRLTAGIDNVTDREPATTSGSNWNATYDYQGRYAWAGVTYQF
ncbi:TonB-dependent receptor plug domain-containing protein [Microbulbifer variabilis]|uniref:TonB-dependent receptor n=1 Tax=Microbulbifer variabilis TaxID=266805 RepID=A0ABY4VK79_9GAMM|nr:TonB-dependent receptor [Microbulbifer variabilis]USD22314.1 TonB-dependent receptor [Microbulbifer variabilis]